MAASSSSKVCWDLARATPNVLPLAEGRLLTALCDEGLQYLFAGVKANVGLRAGCHMFEISIVEFLEPPESRPPPRHFAPTSRQLLRVGFTTREASVLMDNEAAEQVFLDSLGQISVPGSKSRVTSRLRHDQVIALVLNLDDESPEAHSLSIFRDGERVCSQPLPDSLRGKTLYPTVTFKNLTLNANLGPTAAYPLGHSMLEAAQGAEVAEGPQKPEVLFPVGLPDQGLFDFVDQFLAENSRISELSERRAVTWAEGSGLPQGPHQQKSQDRPSTNFGIPLLDDGSCHKSLTAAAPAMKRDWLLLELNNNLRAAERQKALARFSSRDFKRIAVVAVGEPTAEYKARVHEMLLTEKEAAVAKERAEKPMEKPPAPQENGEPASEGEAKDVEMKDEPAEEEKPVELTEEEKSQWFRKLNPPDLSSHTLAKCFADYSLPKEEEGFDEIRYVWQSRDDCERIMSEWVLEQKKTMRVEDLVPSSWFKEKLDGWQKQLQEWKKKQSDTREAIKRGDFAKKPRTEPAPEAEKPEEKPEEEKEEKQEESKEGEAEKPEVNEEELEVFKVEDVMDVGNGKPLFLHFVYEDWVLLNLRVELHLLLHGFRHDVADPDRLSFPERHLEFYFQRYYRKVLQLKMFGVPSNDELVQLVKDTVRINEARFLEAVLPQEEPLENFLRFTEERRRHRQCCIDAGDETAVLRFLRPNPPPPREPRHEERKGWGKKGRYEGKDGKGHDRNDRPLARSKGGPREGKGREFDQGYRSNYTRDRPRQEWRGGDQNVRVPPVRGFGDRDRGQKRPYPAPPASAYSSKPRY